MSDILLFSESTPSPWGVSASGGPLPLTDHSDAPLLDKCAKLAGMIHGLGVTSLRLDYANVYRFESIALNLPQQDASAQLAFVAPIDIPGLLVAESDASLIRAEDFTADAETVVATAKTHGLETLTLLRDAVAPGAPYGGLVKIDRCGGGQVPGVHLRG